MVDRLAARFHPTRRRLVGAVPLLLLCRPAFATPAERDDALRLFAGDATIEPGRVHLDLPPLVENGNAAPLTVTVDSPMTPDDYVRRITVVNERNPQPQVVTVQLGPRSGSARLTTRIRLATSQRILAVAETSDGRYWSGAADVIVTLAACVEG